MSLRDQFMLNPEIIFLNHGSFGATPRPVFERYQLWQRELEAQPVEFLGRKFTDLMLTSRSILAGYLGVPANTLVYVPNATTGINVVAHSLNLKAGDEILASDHEYGAMDRTWRFLSKKNGFTYIRQPVRIPVTTPEAFFNQIWSGVTECTRVIFLSHITSPTALIFPIKRIIQQARERGILTVIDGAHAPGQIPLSLSELDADFYSGNLHKWLCAPKGSAFLYARPEVQALLEPLVVSWGWESDSPGPSPFIDHLEWTGTRDISAYLSVPEAIRFQEEHDWETIRKVCHELASFTRSTITRLTGLPPIQPDLPDWYAQMVAVEIPAELDPNDLKTHFYNHYHIEVPLITLNSRNLMRVSYQAYNDESDAQALISAVSDIFPTH